MPGSGCFIFARVRSCRRTVVAVRNPGAALRRCSDSELQTLTNGLCETTAIDIYLISPRLSSVSTMSRPAIILWVLVSFFRCRYGWCQGPPLLTSPTGPPIGAPGQRGEREKVRGRWRGEKVRLKASGAVEKHTPLCVFTCLADELSYLLHGRG